jgi:SAM-dependent methyltransferase
MKAVLYILRLVLPKWLASDIYNRLTHAYWRRCVGESEKSDGVRSEGTRDRVGRVSARRAFKRVNRKKVLGYLRKENVRTVLDVGCGVGNLVEELAREGFDAYGITINQEEIRRSENKNIFLHDIQEDAGGSRLGAKQFDAIVSFDCLEHLKDEGLFISYIPPIRWIECDYHIIVYSPRQFRWLLNLAGFDLIERDGRYRMSKNGVVYYARKVKDDGPVYGGVME